MSLIKIVTAVTILLVIAIPFIARQVGVERERRWQEYTAAHHCRRTAFETHQFLFGIGWANEEYACDNGEILKRTK